MLLTDRFARIAIADVPACTYTLKLWHELLGELEQLASVGDMGHHPRQELECMTVSAPAVGVSTAASPVSHRRSGGYASANKGILKLGPWAVRSAATGGLLILTCGGCGRLSPSAN